MSAFASVRERMIATGMVDGTTDRLTAAGMAYTDRIIAELKLAPPPPDGVRLPGVKWNTKRRNRNG